MVAVFKPELQEDCVIEMKQIGLFGDWLEEDQMYLSYDDYCAVYDDLDQQIIRNDNQADEIYDLNIVINDLRNELGEAYRRLAEAENQRDEYYARISS